MQHNRTAALLLLAALLLAALPCSAQQPDTYDLEQAVAQALEANDQIASARAEIRSAKAGRRGSISAFFPEVNTGYNYTQYDKNSVNTFFYFRHTYQLVFNVNQDIFTGFRLSNKLLKAQLAEEQAGANLDNEELSLILAVQEAFLNLLKARENVRTAEDSLDRLESQLNVTQAFYDVGLKPRLDVLQADVDLANAEDQLLQAENAVATQEARLNTLLGLGLEAEVDYDGKLLYSPCTLTLEQSLEEAYANRPDLKMADLAAQIARKDYRIAQSGLYPQVSADFNWRRYDEKFDLQSSEAQEAWDIQVQAQWKVFDFGETWFKSEEAREYAESVLADAKNAKTEATFQVKARYLKIDEAAKRIRVAKKALAQAKEGYRMAVARYQAQVGTNTDVLDAQENLTGAQSNLTAALADYQIALARLYVSIGRRNLSLLTD